jgi:hypothetical protein
VSELPLRARSPGPPKRARRRGLVRALAVAAIVLVAFLLGIAVARTLDERPRDGGVVTSVGTVTLPEAETTVTVTATAP